MGGTPVAEATYDFGYGTDPVAFLATAAALENTGVSAYDGAGAVHSDPRSPPRGGRHRGGRGATRCVPESHHWHRAIPGNRFETTLTPAEVLAIATPFIVG